MDYKILKKKIYLKDMTVEMLSERMKGNGVEISANHLNLKMNGKYEFNRAEIKAIKEVLGLTDAEVMDIFFDGEQK